MKIGENISVQNWYAKVDYTALSEKEFRLDSDHVVKWTNKTKPYKITIPKGFTWDGATVFRIFTSLIGYSRSGLLFRPSLPHDYIYVNKGWIFNQLTNEMEFVSRKHSDELFYKECRMAGVPEKDARKLYQLIRLLGRWYWRDFSDFMPFKKRIK
jgi:hypothetical protein